VNEAIMSRLDRSPNACPQDGMCDNALTRNGYIPGVNPPILTIRMYIHVFRNTDGTNAAATAADVTNQMNQLNSDFLPSGIQFEYDWRFVNSTTYRNLTNAEDNPMKNTYAISPDSQLNVFVVSLASQGLLGYAYLPWSPNSLQTTGGCVVTDAANGGFGAGRKTMTHEVGHNLGLHHTQRGVSEVNACDACYESPGAADTDLTGDLCADTRPTPTNFNCSDPAGTSPCNGATWAPSSFRNYMGYASDACYTNFSLQQMGRMRCWIQDALATWLSGVTFSSSPNFGPAPLSVNFVGQTAKVVSLWDWDFGDENGSSDQSPNHIYQTPGLRDVSVTITTASGNYSAEQPDLIYVHADTIDAAEVTGGPSQKIKVDISAQNYIPLGNLIVPITWSGPLSLPLDSIRTTGLRSAPMDVDTLFTDPANKRLVLTISGIAGATLAPGSGPILSLWFRLPPFNLAGVNNISLNTVALWSVQFTAQPGLYSPAVFGGSVSMSCCKVRTGNIDNDASDITDIADITALIDHLFISLTPLACKAEANCDGDAGGTVDIADLTQLIDHLFITLAQLPLCQ